MKSIRALLLVALSSISVASCALNDGYTKPDHGDNDPTKDVFISIQGGKIVAVNSDGEMVPLKKIKLPFKHDITEIKSVETITILKLKGSEIELYCTPSYCFLY